MVLSHAQSCVTIQSTSYKVLTQHTVLKIWCRREWPTTNKRRTEVKRTSNKGWTKVGRKSNIATMVSTALQLPALEQQLVVRSTAMMASNLQHCSDGWQLVALQRWPAACDATAMASNLRCCSDGWQFMTLWQWPIMRYSDGRELTVLQWWPTFCDAAMMASSSQCYGDGQQRTTTRNTTMMWRWMIAHYNNGQNYVIALESKNFVFFFTQ